MSRDVLEIRVATYFGKPIPLLHSLVGNPIKWVKKKDGSSHTEPHPCDPCGSRLWCAQGGTDDRSRVAHDYMRRVITALARRIKGVQVEEASVQVEHVRKLRKLGQRLCGTGTGPCGASGPHTRALLGHYKRRGLG
jgi:hypothetical protein